MEWIDFNDKKPKYRQRILVWYGKTRTRKGFADVNEYTRYEYITMRGITHWMPLPEQP